VTLYIAVRNESWRCGCELCWTG